MRISVWRLNIVIPLSSLTQCHTNKIISLINSICWLVCVHNLLLTPSSIYVKGGLVKLSQFQIARVCKEYLMLNPKWNHFKNQSYFVVICRSWTSRFREPTLLFYYLVLKALHFFLIFPFWSHDWSFFLNHSSGAHNLEISHFSL